jgi:AcrR family transcriptional regulator
VDQIADAADVSRASFFRYFPAKDDVLGSDDDGRREAFIAAFRSRPEEDPLAALREAVRQVLDGMDPATVERTRTYAQVITGSRALLGRAYEIRIRWIRELSTELLSRLQAAPDTPLFAAMLAEMTLSVLEIALRTASTDDTADFDAIIDRGFSLLHLPAGLTREDGHA